MKIFQLLPELCKTRRASDGFEIINFSINQNIFEHQLTEI